MAYILIKIHKYTTLITLHIHNFFSIHNRFTHTAVTYTMYMYIPQTYTYIYSGTPHKGHLSIEDKRMP